MIYEHASIWKNTNENSKLRPSLEQNLEADIVIVGAGISGLTTAYLLADTGKNIVVVEAHELGMGTSGYSTGNLYTLIDQHLTALIDKWGLEKARDVLKSRETAIALIESIIKKENIECDFQRVKFSYFSEDDNEDDQHFVESEAAAAHDLGIVCKKQTRINALPFLTKLALEFPNQAQFHPLKYLTKLAQCLPSNVKIFESSPVMDINYKDKIVIGKKFKLKADNIVVATGVPKGICPVQFKLKPIREYALAAELKEGDFPGIYWSMNADKKSVRTFTQGDKSYVLVIGKKYKTGHHSNRQTDVNELNNYLSKRFIMNDVRIWWSSQTYQSADMLPFIGEFTSGCYSLTGFSADGLVYGTLGASLIADHIKKKKNPYEQLYAFQRRTLLKSAKKMMKEAVNNLCQYASDFPGLHTVKLEDIKTNEGGVVEKNGEKVAVFKDEKNTFHCVSAVCTHMKCIVAFNSLEKTWDCPCHASRFTVDGQVIEGPALKNLEGKSL